MILPQRVKKKALELGFDLVGIAPARPPDCLNFFKGWLQRGLHGSMEYLSRQASLRSDPRSLLPSARSVVAVGLNYWQPNEPTPGYPRLARYALGRDYHKVVRSKLAKLARELLADVPGVAFRVCVDSAPIFDRYYAQQAGLGWFGKNTCLISREVGSWFVIGLLLTDLEIETDRPSVGNCGTCKRCVEACPTGAIVHEDGRWQVDARRCVSYLTIESPLASPEIRRGGWTFGCDVCQEVCPFNRFQKLTQEGDFLAKREWPSLIHLCQVSQEEWDSLTRGSAVRRAGYTGLKANAVRALRGDSPDA